ncbi:MAG: PEP-CTERM sorting domain-containing protein [Planctomycetales bacterium]|nr:PEP-CTERM sorting domain-containing protein [Planctomycetales bacterium]
MSVTRFAAAMVAALGCLVAQANANLIITGVFDGPLTGGLPKVVELYAKADVADLSTYGVGAANNGGGTDGVELVLSGSASMGDFLYVTDTGSPFDGTMFSNYFGVSPSLLFDGNFANGGAASINGDDAVELFYDATGAFAGSETVVDVFGDINVDGSGLAWDYLDGWAYRKNGTGPDGSTFVESNWTYSGINVTDGEVSNGTAATPFPIGSYSMVPEPATCLLALCGLGVVAAARRR